MNGTPRGAGPGRKGSRCVSSVMSQLPACQSAFLRLRLVAASFCLSRGRWQQATGNVLCASPHTQASAKSNGAACTHRPSPPPLPAASRPARGAARTPRAARSRPGRGWWGPRASTWTTRAFPTSSSRWVHVGVCLCVLCTCMCMRACVCPRVIYVHVLSCAAVPAVQQHRSAAARPCCRGRRSAVLEPSLPYHALHNVRPRRCTARWRRWWWLRRGPSRSPTSPRSAATCCCRCWSAAPAWGRTSSRASGAGGRGRRGQCM